MLPLPCMLVCSFVCANRTRDRGCSKHPVFPAPSDFEEGKQRCKPRAQCAARSRTYIHVTASESNPLSPHARKDGLLRGARHRARIRATRWLAMTAGEVAHETEEPVARMSAA